jgi:hypothetical protein
MLSLRILRQVFINVLKLSILSTCLLHGRTKVIAVLQEPGHGTGGQRSPAPDHGAGRSAERGASRRGTPICSNTHSVVTNRSFIVADSLT